MLKKQHEMLLECEKGNRTVAAGPLTTILIRGRIDILYWFLGVKIRRGKVNNPLSSKDARILKMLQKQKNLLIESVNDRRPGSTSKIEVQGRIEMLEWLLLND